MVGLIILDDDIGHILCLSADLHLVRLVPAGTEDGSPDRQDTGQGPVLQAFDTVLGQATKTVTEADHLHGVIVQRGLADTANRGVETGAVSTSR